MSLVKKAAFDVLTATEWNDVIDAILQPVAIVRRVAAQVIATGGGGANINFDTEDADTDTMFAPTSDTVTIKTAGKYRAVLFASLAGSGQFYQITHNATVRASQSGGVTANLVTPDFQAAVSDTVKVGVFQSSGSNQNCTGTLSVIRVRE